MVRGAQVADVRGTHTLHMADPDVIGKQAIQRECVTFQIGEQAIQVAVLKENEITLDDREWEALFAGRTADLQPVHLESVSNERWFDALMVEYKKEADIFKCNYVFCTYRNMPWRYFVALNKICERFLGEPLEHFREQLEAKKREETKKREQAKHLHFDIHDANATPPSPNWYWTAQPSEGFGRGRKETTWYWAHFPDED